MFEAFGVMAMSAPCLLHAPSSVTSHCDRKLRPLSANPLLLSSNAIPPSATSVFLKAAQQSWVVRCSASDDSTTSASPSPSETEVGESSERRALQDGGNNGDAASARTKRGETRSADSTDWIASSLTRRFGLGAGLAWVGLLAFGVISEQIKTRTEVFLEEQGTRDVESAKEVILPNNIHYADLRAGGGSSPQRSDLVVVDLLGKVVSTGEVFVDTLSGNQRSLAFVFGARPYSRGMCDGLEYALRSMKVGGKRRVIIPPELGFGDTGAILGEGVRVPGGASLEYVVQLQRVSIAPS